MSTVNEAFKHFYPTYEDEHSVSSEQTQAAWSIMKCKTAELGANTYICDECQAVDVHYNSCRNRHCPLCQGVSKAVWVDKRCKDVLDAPYFHVVFTIPEQLQTLVYQNQRLLYTLMYKAASQTIAELSLDKRYLGAQPGFFSVLHTWGQDLRYHPHIHAVIMAGGLTKDKQWRSSRKKFFIPVKVMSKKFRGKFLHHLKKYYTQKNLEFHGQLKHLSEPEEFQKLIDECYAKDWYSYSKEAFAGPLAVIKYLGRYTHRIAISNSRIVSVRDGKVTFRVRGKISGEAKTKSLEGKEFIRRFLMHVLPKGFVKVRYYGLLASRNRKTKLELCRKLTGSYRYRPKYEGLNTTDILSLLLGRDVTVCPQCNKGRLKRQSGASP
jgi:hypothetical protein